MLVEGAIYRFIRTEELQYYRAARTKSGVEFLYPIGVSGTRIAGRHENGRRYVILYFMTRWGKLAAGGYWLDPRQGFDKAYVTDATEADLHLVALDLEELSLVDEGLDDILNRGEIELDLDIWGSLLEE
ncbi:MAG: hypothetical protein ACK2UO_12630 [Caldilineaceae bacterium]